MCYFKFFFFLLLFFFFCLKFFCLGGNFHGEYPAKAMDYLAIAIHEIANISEVFIHNFCNMFISSFGTVIVHTLHAHTR